ncbi:MAG: ArsC family reductase [Rhodoferax sp.]|nr:ArsC family reductase [Rhodoferax sp.]
MTIIGRMTILYGIPNCDTVKKARTWLDTHHVAYTFHDFKKAGVPDEALDAWLEAVGWEKLVNHKGTTWRQLDPAAQAAVQDSASAAALIRAQPSVVKRPVVDWQDCPGQDTTVGFDAESWSARA